MPVPSVAPMLIMVSCHMPERAAQRPALALAALRDQPLHGLAPHQPRAEAPGAGGRGRSCGAGLRRGPALGWLLYRCRSDDGYG